MITCGVNVTSTLPGLWMVEKWGRRNLLLFGAVGMAVSQFIVAGVGTGAGIENLAAQKALIAFVCIYIFFFACSWGPVAWIVTGESKSSFYYFPTFWTREKERLTLLLTTVFPLKVRAKSLSMTTGTFPLPSLPLPLSPLKLTSPNPPSIQLAPQLGNSLLNTLHGKLGPRKRQPPKQSILRLGLLLLRLHIFRVGHDLRNQGSVAGTSG